MSVLKHLTAAPHRPFFLLGSFLVLLSMMLWLLVLEGGVGSQLLWPANAVHAWTMLYGSLPPFVFGFLFTAMPNWVNGGQVRRPIYLLSAALICAGSLLFFVAIFVSRLDQLALGLHALGWAVAVWSLWRVVYAAPAGDKRQPWIVLAGVSLGLIGDLAFLGWRLGGGDEFVAFGEELGLWCFLTPLFLAVCHRMIPYFTSRVVNNYVLVRPYGALLAMLAACVGHALLVIAGLPGWTWLTDLPLSAIAFWFSAVWGIRRSLHVRLLGMLHIAFVWAGIAFALFAIGSLMRFAGDRGLAFAPLHALAIGFFGSMLVGMVSRVSLGHSGRKLECDRLTWYLFLAIQSAAVVRMLPDLFPEWISYQIVSVAGVIWLVAFAIWAARYAPFYWRPRVDGRPG